MHDAEANGEPKVMTAPAEARSGSAGSGGVSASEPWGQQVLDSLVARVAVLNAEGRIVAVNRPWREFGLRHGVSDPKAFAEGADYVEILRRAARAEERGAVAILEGVQSVLEGRSESFHCEYVGPCLSEESWYAMRVAACGDGKRGAVVTHEEITERKRSELHREAAVEFLRMANECLDRESLARAALDFVWDRSGCEAVGLRLKGQGDYPYYQVRGFSQEFVQMERTLCPVDSEGHLLRDESGKPILECTCGLLLSGRKLPELPCFTSGGAFWTNEASAWLHTPSDQDPRVRPRNRCIYAGYESVALIPLEANGERVGLLQLNDRRKGRFSAASVALWERLAGYLAVALAKFDAEAALREKEREWTTLLGNLPGMAYRCRNDASWTMQLVSDGCAELTGYSASDLVGNAQLAYGDLVVPEDAPRIWADVQAALAESRRYQLSYRIRSRSGEIKWVWEQGSGVYSSSGQLVALEGFITDVTARQHAIEALRKGEEAREALEKQLRQSQKLEAIGRLAGGIAHDFNNILAVVMMNLALLAEEDEVTVDGRLAIAEIEKGAQRASGLVRQLLQFARRQVLRVERVEVGRLLGELHRMLSCLIGEGTRLELGLESGPHWIDADPGMIEQVAINLVVNARDAMPEGGRVSMVVRGVTLEAQDLTRQPFGRPGRFVCLVVSDTGSGMGEEVRRHLFEPFFTTKEVGKGTGLGLSTIYGIVEQHRGWVEVESAEGKGSSFRVFLPAAEGPAPGRSEVGAPEAVAGGRETVLVVEDEPALRATTTRLLRRLGYRVLEAEDGADALRAWSDVQGQVDLLLTDMVMPGPVGGLELAARLRAECPSLPVVLASGYSPEGLEQSEAKVPGAVFVAKPALPSDLARVLRETLDRPRTARESRLSPSEPL